MMRKLAMSLESITIVICMFPSASRVWFRVNVAEDANIAFTSAMKKARIER